MFLLAVGLWMQVAAAQPAGQPQQVSVQAKVQPETVTVGQHFTVAVTVHAPAALAQAIQFPSDPDTGTNQQVVVSVTPMQRHDVSQGGFVDATATYTLSAWIPGKISMALDDVIVDKAHVKLPHGDTILVASVLPKDSVARSKATPKLPRQLLPEPPLIKRLAKRLAQHKSYLLLIILIVALLLALILWMLFRRKHVPTVAGPSADWVEGEFQRVEAMRLLEKGESELHAILMTGVVRKYLIDKFPSVHASATTRELVSALKSEKMIPADQTLALFERVDLLKFAHDQIAQEAAKTIGGESRAVVHEVEAREAAAKAAALEAERLAAEANAGNKSGKSGNSGKKTPGGRKAA